MTKKAAIVASDCLNVSQQLLGEVHEDIGEGAKDLASKLWLGGVNELQQGVQNALKVGVKLLPQVPVGPHGGSGQCQWPHNESRSRSHSRSFARWLPCKHSN